MDKPHKENRIPLNPEFEDLIYQCLGKGLKLHSFPDPLEKMYQKHDQKSKLKRFFWFGIIGLIFYNLFLIGDKAMLPDIFAEAVFIRVFIISPLLILTIAASFFKSAGKFSDLIAGTIIFLISISIMFFLLISNSPNVNNYHTGIIIMLVVANIVIRMRFSCAVFLSLLIFILFIFTVYNIPQMNEATARNSIMVLFTIVCFTLIGNYEIENGKRFSFLYFLLRRINAAELEESNRKLQMIAITDSLTGLTNRRQFDVTLKKEWKACFRSKQPISLIFIDIDFFKNYNDSYGHQKGDECIRQVSSQMKRIAKRPRDIAARYGGEEFVLLTPETDSKGAMNLAEKIREAIENLKIPHEHSDAAKFVTISAGVTTLKPGDNNDYTDLIRLADTALYQAKSRGRNRVLLNQESE